MLWLSQTPRLGLGLHIAEVQTSLGYCHYQTYPTQTGPSVIYFPHGYSAIEKENNTVLVIT